jgi:phosphonate transport system substrate-binding protein
MISITSIQAPNQDFIIAGIADYLGKQSGIDAEVVLGIPWQERERLLDAGKIQIGWICGLPYVRKVALFPNRFELLAAPVMQAARYQMKPIYYSDVIVHQSSSFTSFADLRGVSWAYNEPRSHSGCSLTRYHLSTLDENKTFFSSIVEAGSHQKALDLILRKEVDASAIDSTVLEQEIVNRPEIRGQIRIVEILGPSPIPPLVIARQVPLELKRKLRALLLGMHADRTGRDILEGARIANFAVVSDRDYDLIRQMDRLGSRVNLKATQPPKP